MVSEYTTRFWKEAENRFIASLHSEPIEVPDPTTEPEFLALWRRNVQINHSFTLIEPIYKKVRRYALQWREVSWAPHFYDLVDVFSHNERLSITEVHRASLRAYVEMSMEAVLHLLRTPVQPDYVTMGNYFTKPSEPSHFRLDTIEYTFPLVRCERRIDPFLFMQDGFQEGVRFMLGDFKREAEQIVRTDTKVNDVRVIDFGGRLPRLKIQRTRQNES